MRHALGPIEAQGQAEPRVTPSNAPALRAAPGGDRGARLLLGRSQVRRLGQRRPQVGEVLRAGTGAGTKLGWGARLRAAAAGGFGGGAEAEDAAAEGDRAGGEPGPAEGEAGEDVGQPVDVEEDAAGGDSDCDADGGTGEGRPRWSAPPASGDQGE